MLAIYPNETHGSRTVISARNPRVDGWPEFGDVYILAAHGLWDDDRQPVLIADDDHSDMSLISADELEAWKDEAQLAALAACKPFLEDGPEISGSDGSSDHGEEIDDMYTPECPTVEQAKISEATMQLSIASGRAGSAGTVSGDARAGVLPQ
jgi:PHD/YefM family antitoxin component YafN of YafNO toxin-antitoxin module